MHVTAYDTVCMELGACHYAAEILCIAPWCMLYYACVCILSYTTIKNLVSVSVEVIEVQPKVG